MRFKNLEGPDFTFVAGTRQELQNRFCETQLFFSIVQKKINSSQNNQCSATKLDVVMK